MSEALDFVRRFRGKHVLVLGDAMLDAYFEGSASRIAPEAPVPVVAAQHRTYAAGGAANVAVNARSLGADVALVSAIGADETGWRLKKVLARRGVSPDHLIEVDERASIQKLRIVADGQYLVRYDEGDCSDLPSEAEQALLARLRRSYHWAEAVVVSDYLAGVITPRVVAELQRLTKDSAKLVIVDSKNLKQFRLCNVSVITPNHLEAQKALDLRLREDAARHGREIEAVGWQLLEQMNTKWAVVTMGEDGAMLFEREAEPRRIIPRPVKTRHVIGAGDSFTSALALALAAGSPIGIACEIASEVAAIAVSRPGTVAVSQQELLQALSGVIAVPHPRDLVELVKSYRRGGKRIVFTNGCFDILHSGHIAYLQEAKRHGDVLIVGVNSDASVQRLKGQSRPVNGQFDRLAVVAAIQCVDHAILFEEDTPERLIREVRPDVHVKGGDYHIDDIPEAAAVRECGGEVVIVPLVEGKSSTAIIDKIAGLKERAA